MGEVVSLNDLRNVRGIGKKTLQRIREQLVYEDLDYVSEYDSSLHIQPNSVVHGDCLNLMNGIPDKSVDMVLADLPYEITSCSWDSLIDLDKLWTQYRRIIKDTGVIALTASQPFTSQLVMSNLDWFRHEWIWIKNRGSNFANTVREPMKEHEQVLIFIKENGWTYNKQMQPRTGAGLDRVRYELNHRSKSENYREFEGREGVNLPDMRVPSTWQKFNTEVGLHPTQKPVKLFEYLIKTYTNEGDLVLDNVAGSGTTGVACMNTGRNYILIEKEKDYFEKTKERLGEIG